MKVPELKKNLQVGEISVVNKRREELLDFNVCRSSWTCHGNLRQARKPDGCFCKVGDGKVKLFLIPTRSSRRDVTLSFGLTSRYFFLAVNTFVFFDVCGISFRCFRRRLFGAFRWRCRGNANIEGTGFNLVRPGPPSKWTEHIPVCLITFKLSRRQAAIHRKGRSRPDIPTNQCLFALRWGNGKKSLPVPDFCQTFFSFLGAICVLKSKTVMIRRCNSSRRLISSPH